MKSKNSRQFLSILVKIFLSCFTAVFLFDVGAEFYSIASDYGHLMMRWRLTLAAFSLILLAMLGLVLTAVWFPRRLAHLKEFLCSLRLRAGKFVYLLVVLITFLPIVLYQYTSWGEISSTGWLRYFIYLLIAGVVAALLTRQRDKIISRAGLLSGFLLVSATMMLATAFVGVTSYPLSLTWSEGNRLWDYSLLFGRSIYHYPPDKIIPTQIDFGRQFLWGLPFIIPGVDIRSVRLWSALVSTLPYALLGWCAFRRPRLGAWLTLFMGLWIFIFLKQTAIYTPLVVAAILVMLAWHRKWFIAIPLLMLAGWYVYLTRTTWALAPAIWIFTLVFAGEEIASPEKTHPWGKAILYSAAALGGAFLTFGWRVWQERMTAEGATSILPVVWPTVLIIMLALAGAVYWQRGFLVRLWQVKAARITMIVIIGLVILGAGAAYVIRNLAAVRDQPLLWERLLPNSTNPQGVLLSLVLAVLPLIALLVWQAATRRWPLDAWQAVVVVLPLVGFMGVGIIASVKSGGGSNLHNLDMFMVGLVVAACLAWQAGAHKVITKLDAQPLWVYPVLIAMLILPATETISSISPLDIQSGEKVYNVVARIRDEVKKAAPRGEVLFMDQRQLLTFGLVKNVALVPEYEKKILMDEAMAGDQTYFDRFLRRSGAPAFCAHHQRAAQGDLLGG